MAAELHDLLSQTFSPVESFSKPDEEELLVFGYSCKLFRDDERALFHDQGKHLIPWMGDESLQIDRYDVRGYLADLCQHEAKPHQSQHPNWDLLSPEEKHVEQLCEEERYLALYTDLTEEQIYHEEELKRLKAALADEGAYHEIGFSYEDNETSSEFKSEEPEDKDTEDEPFTLPEGLALQEDIPVPDTMKIHMIIERTAVFVSQHGTQMEIVIKSKQANNPQFDFLAFDSSLNPYYKYLIASIKSGKYQPKPPESERECDEMVEEEDSDDDHYLHPSLLSGKKDAPDPVNIPDLPVFRSVNDTYSKLVKNLMEKSVHSREGSPVTKEVAPLPPPPMFTSVEGYWQHFGGPPVESPHLVMAYNNQPPPPGDESLYQMFTQSVGGDVIYHMLPPPPPPDIQPIVDKMAEYVARSGEDFEMVVKSKRDKRFEFLSPHHEYHQYYLYKKKCHTDLRKQQLERLQKINDETNPKKKNLGSSSHSSTSSGGQVKSGPIAPVSFSIKAKDGSDPGKDKKCFPLVGEGDSEEEGMQSQEGQQLRDNVTGAVNATAKNPILEQLVANAVVNIPPPASPPKPTEEEIQAKKILEAKAAEARLAGERLRDKLANAAREKMAQQTKERQLQLERKRKAALFLTMLKSSGNAAAVSSSKTSEKGQTVFGPPTAEEVENGNSSRRNSPYEAKSPISEIDYRSNSDAFSEKVQSRSRTSHNTNHSRNGSPDHYKSSKHHSSDGKRSSRARSTKEHKRHKTPPTSYSFFRRSRSRSVSPKRHHRPKSKERSHRR